MSRRRREALATDEGRAEAHQDLVNALVDALYVKGKATKRARSRLIDALILAKELQATEPISA